MSTKTRFSSAYDARGLPDVIRAIALHRRPEDPEALTQKEFDESRKQVPEHAHAPSARQICARLGVGWRDLLTALFEPGRDQTRSISRYQGSGADRELSKEHIRAALRMIATQLGVSTLRPAQYDTARAELLAATARRHRHGQSLKLPTAGQIERVAAGWDRALEIAGLDARPPSTGSTKSVVSYDEAVRRFLVSCGAMPSAKELEAFARAQGFPLPRRPQGGHRKAQLEVQAQFAAAGRWAPATPPPKNQPRAYDFGAVTAQKAGESRRSKRRTREECVAAIVAYLEQVPPGEKVSQKRYGAWRGGTQTSCPERVRAARRLDSAACGGAPAPSGRGVVDERASLRRRRGFVVLDSRPQPSVQIPAVLLNWCAASPAEADGGRHQRPYPVDVASTDWLDPEQDDWTAIDAGETLLSYAIAIAEQGPSQVPAKGYRDAHQRLLRDPTAKRAASPLLARLRTPDLMWGQLRSVATGSGSWQLRRNAAHELIDPVLDALHSQGESPVDDLVSGAATRLDAESVREAWTRALERRATHPEGAITMARTLLESTLKTILDDRNIAYREGDDLPALYKAVSGELGLAPGSYSEQAFKQILGGCHSVVVGLGSLRNKAGDAHGAGRKRYRPAERHAALAVNLAGSTALFLIETHEARE